MRLALLYISVFVALGGFSVSAQVDRTKKPSAGPPRPLVLPKIQRASLKNGLKVMLAEYHQLPIVQLNLVVQTGTAADPPQKAGVGTLTMRMLDEGTRKRTALQIADELDFIGANLFSSASYDGCFVGLQTLKEHLSTAVDIYSDVILHPTFPQQEFERVKKELLTSLIQQRDQPAAVATRVFATRLYGEEHPYGRPNDGTEASVTQITVQDLKDFYEKYARPNNATLIVVGDVTLKELLPTLERHFGSWERKTVPEVKIPEISAETKPMIFLVDKPQAAQSQIRIGHVGLPRSTPDYFPVVVMNTILGGGFNSRLNWNLREQKGYTYGTGSSFQFRKGAGPFTTTGGFRTDVTDKSVVESLKEINRLKTEEVSESDLRFAKDFLIRSLPRGFETPGQIANQLATLVLYQLPDDYFETYTKNVEAVTAADVKRVAEKYLRPDSMLIAIVGDVAAVKQGLEMIGHGPVVLCDAEGKPLN